MNCPQCSQIMIEAQATNFGEKYQYCRGCKKELKELLRVAGETFDLSTHHKPAGLEAWLPLEKMRRIYPPAQDVHELACFTDADSTVGVKHVNFQLHNEWLRCQCGKRVSPSPSNGAAPEPATASGIPSTAYPAPGQFSS